MAQQPNNSSESEAARNSIRRERYQRLASRLLGLFIIAGSLLAGWVMMEYRSFVEKPLVLPEETLHYTIPRGASLRWIAQDLAQRGIVEPPLYFLWYARWSGKGHIRAGEYELTHGMTVSQMLDIFTSGKVVQHSFTLVEGWTFRQVLDALHRHEALEPRLLGLSDDEIMARIGHPGEHPEGRFFPDTYYFPRGATDISVLQRAYDRMQRHLEEEWEKRAQELPLTSPYEALILASIVEKETGVAEERAEIAGVFIRRLRLGMRLQTDPTVIYGLGPSFDGNLRRRDLVRDTPYNTYVRSGLPPTPIAMPGLASLRAALHPADGTALYFVSRGDGTHYFSSTLSEHLEAVSRYQLRKKAGRNAQPARQTESDAGKADTGQQAQQP